MATRRKPRRIDRFNQGVELSLGITTSLRRHLREIENSDTVGEAWADVAESMQWGDADDATSPGEFDPNQLELSIEATTEVFQGPMPDPRSLAAYGRVDPSFPERNDADGRDGATRSDRGPGTHRGC